MKMDLGDESPGDMGCVPIAFALAAATILINTVTVPDSTYAEREAKMKPKIVAEWFADTLNGQVFCRDYEGGSLVDFASSPRADSWTGVNPELKEQFPDYLSFKYSEPITEAHITICKQARILDELFRMYRTNPESFVLDNWETE